MTASSPCASCSESLLSASPACVSPQSPNPTPEQCKGDAARQPTKQGACSPRDELGQPELCLAAAGSARRASIVGFYHTASYELWRLCEVASRLVALSVLPDTLLHMALGVVIVLHVVDEEARARFYFLEDLAQICSDNAQTEQLHCAKEEHRDQQR